MSTEQQRPLESLPLGQNHESQQPDPFATGEVRQVINTYGNMLPLDEIASIIQRQTHPEGAEHDAVVALACDAARLNAMAALGIERNLSDDAAA